MNNDAHTNKHLVELSLSELDRLSSHDLSKHIMKIMSSLYFENDGKRPPVDYIRLVLSIGADPLFISVRGETLLTFARDVDLVNLLLEYEVSPVINAREFNLGNTALKERVLENNTEVIKILIQHGANPNIQDFLGDTCLHIAASKGLFTLYRYLCDAGGDPTIKNYRGQSAEHLYQQNHAYVDYEGM